MFALTWYKSKWYYTCGAGEKTIDNATIYTDLQVVDFNNKNNKITFNGVEYGECHTCITDIPIALFKATTDTQNSYFAQAKIYYCKIYCNSVLMRYLIPVKRISDNKICMYDMVSGEFFENNGTGEFIAGSEISNGGGM